jgi:acyl-coenzyme A thioesterase PaaI-like protein
LTSDRSRSLAAAPVSDANAAGRAEGRRTATPTATAHEPTVPPRTALDPEPIPPFQFSPHNCFACGTLNAHGLGLVLHVEHGRSWTDLTLGRSFEGWEGIAHGGIICTILDEVMAWALVGADNWGVTARMSVVFRRPVLVGREIHAEGTIATTRRRIVETTARLVDAETRELLATATGTYVAAGEERKRELRERYGYRLLTDELPDGASPDPVDAPTVRPAAPTPRAKPAPRSAPAEARR